LKFRFTAPTGDATFPMAPVPSAPFKTDVMARPTLSPPKGSSNRLWIMIAGVGLVAVAAVLPLPRLRSKSDDAANRTELCQKAQAAIAAQDWAESVSDLSLAQQLKVSCPFSIDQELTKARQNQDARNALQNADRLVAAGQYRKAMDVLLSVPA